MHSEPHRFLPAFVYFSSVTTHYTFLAVSAYMCYIGRSIAQYPRRNMNFPERRKPRNSFKLDSRTKFEIMTFALMHSESNYFPIIETYDIYVYVHRCDSLLK